MLPRPGEVINRDVLGQPAVNGTVGIDRPCMIKRRRRLAPWIERGHRRKLMIQQGLPGRRGQGLIDCPLSRCMEFVLQPQLRLGIRKPLLQQSSSELMQGLLQGDSRQERALRKRSSGVMRRGRSIGVGPEVKKTCIEEGKSARRQGRANARGCDQINENTIPALHNRRILQLVGEGKRLWVNLK